MIILAFYDTFTYRVNKHLVYSNIIAGIMIFLALCPIIYYAYKYNTYPSYYDIYKLKLSEILEFQIKRLTTNLQSCTGSSVYQEYELFSFDPLTTFTPLTSNRNIMTK